MRKLLVTGGTVFVSRYVAAYFARLGDQVYVLNRNSHPQVPGVTLIQGDRNALGIPCGSIILTRCWISPPIPGRMWRIW